VTEGRTVPQRWRASAVNTVRPGLDEIDLRVDGAPAHGGSPASPAAADPLPARVAALVAEALGDVLGDAPLGPDDDLFDRGLSSLHAARIHAALAREAGALLSNGALFRAPTVAGLTALVRDARERGRFTSLVAIQPGGTRPPFFCVHGGAGTVLHLRPLARALGPDQPFLGLQAPGLLGHGTPLPDVAAMARRYVDEVRAVQPTGPYLLGGYCFGSIVAHEMVRQLHAAGEETAVLVVFNGPTAEALQQRVRDQRARTAPRGAYRKLRRRAALAYMDGRRRVTEVRRDGEIRLARLRHRPLGPRFLRAFYKSRCRHLEQHHRTAPWSGRVVVFLGRGLYEDGALGWRRHGGTVVVHEIAGEHRNQRTLMAEPHASVVARILTEELRRAAAPAVPLKAR
jgi:thioesterase domain-containing protein/aryl carrier-like protein